MSSVVIEITGVDLRATIAAAGDWLHPVARPSDEVLLEGEELIDALSLSVHPGAPSTEPLAKEIDAGREITAWCALSTPWPVEGRLRRKPWLRIGIQGNLQPLVVLVASSQKLRFDFSAGGAPVAAAPRRDDGGPIDQIFAEAVTTARRELAAWLLRLNGARIELHTTDLDPSALAGLAEALAKVPNLQSRL